MIRCLIAMKANLRYPALIMIFVSVLLFLCSGFFFLKSIRENSNNDRVLALILLIVGLFSLFTGIAAIKAIRQYGF